MIGLARSAGLIALLFLASCAGMAARQDAIGQLAGIYRNVVQPIAVVGIGAEQDAGGLSAERAAELRGHVELIGEVLDSAAVGRVPEAGEAWQVLLPFVEQVIDQRVARGEIGPGVGASLKELVRLFGARLAQVGEARP